MYNTNRVYLVIEQAALVFYAALREETPFRNYSKLKCDAKR